MKKNVLFILLIACFQFTDFGQQVTINEVRKTAINFYYKQSHAFNNLQYKSIKTGKIQTVKNTNNLPLYYIVNIKNGGFVAVAGTKSSVPVLFYKYEGKFNEQGNNPAFDLWIKQYKKQIEASYQNQLEQDALRSQLWEDLLNSSPDELIKKAGKSISPLIITEWDQGAFYNALCPEDVNGPDGHAYAGCVATAMGQIMFYHKWPIQGTGSFTYYHPEYDTLSADFGATTYDWDAMPVRLSDYNTPTALLLLHLGISVTMDYGPNGSGMWNHSAALSLRNYFKYCNETEYVFKDSTTLDWDSIIIANLEAKKPLYYAGWADDSSFTSGHAFVCDGYQSPGYYHFNWGWSGAYNGFFYTDNLTPGGSQFTYAQEIIKDIYPDTNNYTYPEGCSGLKTLTYSEGSLNDGSYGAKYQQDLDCEYLIQPECGSSFQVKFNSFFLGAGDTLFVYDGISASGTMLFAFTKNYIPVLASEVSPTIITPTSGALFLNFKTDSGTQDEGWDISWVSEYCNGTITLTDSTGIVSDGSGPCDYKNNSNCKWIVAPTNAEHIYLNFTKFDIATDAFDFMVIYKNALSPSNIFAKYDYQNIPGDTVVDADTCVIYFKTNASDVADGFSIEYSGVLSSVDKKNIDFKNVKIYPNPFTDNAKVVFYVDSPQNVRIEIFNNVMKNIYSSNNKYNTGSQVFYLNDKMKGMSEGIYYLKVTEETNCMTKTIIYQGK